ncbi:MAG: AbrB/MazE/SpoVT family DNA-binding domain-containing protein [Chloroflexi bacterium]|nr:AbrB/MazE/SpoVT family DNA-binding domain-containing protein [Chloroflexota bacterium]
MSKRVKRRTGYTRLSTKNQVTLPAAAVATLGLAPGAEFRVETRGREIVLVPTEDLAARRLRALKELAGSLTGVYEPGYLDQLRSEWRE